MKIRKVMSTVLLLTAALMAVSIIVMHSVAAPTSNEVEIAKDSDVDKSVDKPASNDNDFLEDNLLLMGLSMIMIVLTILGIYLNVKKAKSSKSLKSSKSSTDVTSVEVFVVPDHVNYDHDTWGSSDSNWSKINNAWESTQDEAEPQYGSYEQQYQSLYN